MARLPDVLERRYPYVVLAASVAMIFVASGAGHMLVVCLKAMAEEFQWPRSVPSLAWGILFIGSGAGGILMGAWMDRFGMRLPTVMASVMIGAGAIAVSYVQSAWQLYFVFAVVLGLFGRGAILAPLMANASHWFNSRRGMAIGVVAAGETLGGCFWPPVVHHLQASIGWRDSFLIYGLVAWAVMLPLTMAFRRRPPDQPVAPPKRAADTGPESAPAGLSDLRIQATLCVAVICCCIPMSMPLVHLVSHVGDVCGVPARGAEALAAALFGSFISRAFLLSRLTERFGGLVSLFMFSSVQLLGMVLLGAVTDLPAIYAVSVLFGLGYGGILPSYPVIVREYLPAHQAGRRSAVVVMFGGAGMMLGGWLGGYLYDITGGYFVAFLVGAAANAFNLAIVATLIRQKTAGRLMPLAG